MYQKSKPGPRRKAALPAEPSESKLVTFRLYPEDLTRIDALVAAGYGANRTEVVRRSLAETAKWTLPRK
jgi:hypothetical protein